MAPKASAKVERKRRFSTASPTPRRTSSAQITSATKAEKEGALKRKKSSQTVLPEKARTKAPAASSKKTAVRDVSEKQDGKAGSSARKGKSSGTTKKKQKKGGAKETRDGDSDSSSRSFRGSSTSSLHELNQGRRPIARDYAPGCTPGMDEGYEFDQGTGRWRHYDPYHSSDDSNEDSNEWSDSTRSEDSEGSDESEAESQVPEEPKVHLGRYALKVKPKTKLPTIPKSTKPAPAKKQAKSASSVKRQRKAYE